MNTVFEAESEISYQLGSVETSCLDTDDSVQLSMSAI
jgi:hypothetical protein